MERAKLLKEAEDRVLEVVMTLNRSEHACPTCSLKVRENWTEHQLGEVLLGCLKKLKRVREELEKK